MNPDPLAKKASRPFLFNDGNPLVGSNRTARNASLSPGPKSLVSQRTLRSHTGTIGGGGRPAVLHSPVMQRDTRNGSSFSGNSSDITPNAGSWVSSARSGTSSSCIANQLRDENPRKSLREIRKRLASLKKEKELISFTRKLNEMEA